MRLKKRSENVNGSHGGEKRMMNGKLGDGERSGKEEERRPGNTARCVR